MTDLFKYAQTLATDPPTKVYKKLMELFSQEQLATLGDPPPASDVTKKQRYDQSKVEYESIANKWDQMVKEYGEDVAKFSVTAICDFVAMCMMMIAAGSARIEGLKTALRDKKRSGALTKYGDRAYLIPRRGSKDFLSAMEQWGNLKNNGIVQFKFSANDNFHTFAVERTPDQKGRPEFIVYQSYQNTYSLSHFLKVKEVWSDGALIKVHQQRWKDLPQQEKSAYGNDYITYKQSLIPEMQNIERAMKWIGAGQRLTYEDLLVRVLEPLEMMLDGAASREDYVRMTGSPSTSKTFKVPFLIMLMCDQVSPKEFDENEIALHNCPADLTKYPECG